MPIEAKLQTVRAEADEREVADAPGAGLSDARCFGPRRLGHQLF
jgi:hypothetical protein